MFSTQDVRRLPLAGLAESNSETQQLVLNRAIVHYTVGGMGSRDLKAAGAYLL